MAKEKYTIGLQQFPRLAQLPGVAMIGVSEECDVLYIGTKPVQLLERGGPLRDIGEFIIGIHPDGTFSCTNVTRQVNKFHHPHVQEDGTLCISDGKLEITTAIKDRDICTAVQLILIALHTLDEHPFPSAKISFWPKAGGESDGHETS